MEAEEIEKAGKEYGSKIVVNDAYAHIHYEEGCKFANKHWQEKTRWIPFEERLPIRPNRTKQILCKNKYIVRVVFISCTKPGYLDSIESLKREFTHWKEID